MALFLKDPDADRNFSFDWSDDLAAGESATSPTISITPSGELTAGTPTVDTNVVTAKLSGGTRGKVYRVTCNVTITGGQDDDKSMWIRVAEE